MLKSRLQTTKYCCTRSLEVHHFHVNNLIAITGQVVVQDSGIIYE